jgi:hypothetical protein
MGANRKFHRWQIAFKENKDKAQVKVLSVTNAALFFIACSVFSSKAFSLIRLA